VTSVGRCIKSPAVFSLFERRERKKKRNPQKGKKKRWENRQKEKGQVRVFEPREGGNKLVSRVKGNRGQELGEGR